MGTRPRGGSCALGTDPLIISPVIRPARGETLPRLRCGRHLLPAPGPAEAAPRYKAALRHRPEGSLAEGGLAGQAVADVADGREGRPAARPGSALPAVQPRQGTPQRGILCRQSATEGKQSVSRACSISSWARAYMVERLCGRRRLERRRGGLARSGLGAAASRGSRSTSRIPPSVPQHAPPPGGGLQSARLRLRHPRAPS